MCACGSLCQFCDDGENGLGEGGGEGRLKTGEADRLMHDGMQSCS